MDHVAAGFIRSNANCSTSAPSLCHHISRKPREEICGQSGLLKREGMIGAGNNNQRAVGDACAEPVVKCARVRKSNSPFKIMVGTRIKPRRADNGLKSRNDFDQVLQRVNVVDQPTLAFDGIELVHKRGKPAIGEVHRKQKGLANSWSRRG